MLWTPHPGTPRLPRPAHLDLLLGRFDARPNDLEALTAAAAAAEDASRWSVALRLYEHALSIDPDRATSFAGRGRCRLQLGDPSAALTDLERAEQRRPDDVALLTWLGRALERTGREDHARDAWTRATEISHLATHAARSLLRLAARSGDGDRVLAQCDALLPASAESALVRGYRALGLSMVGDDEAANALVRLDRDVVHLALDAPDGFAHIDHFNRVLAAEVERHAYEDPGASPFLRNDNLAVFGATAHPALVARLQQVIDQVLADPSHFGWTSLVAPPTSGHLRTAGTVLTGSLANAAHLHSEAYLSGVYFAKVPAVVMEAHDGRGALCLGSVRGIVDDHTPSWGTRLIRPHEGSVTLFPSHWFHEALPTFVDDTRVSVAFDLVATN